MENVAVDKMPKTMARPKQISSVVPIELYIRDYRYCIHWRHRYHTRRQRIICPLKHKTGMASRVMTIVVFDTEKEMKAEFGKESSVNEPK